MGWTGTYVGYNPKGKERIEMAIHQEGLSFRNDETKTMSEVIDSALVGNTIYCAVHYTSPTEDCVYASVILTRYGSGEFVTKEMSESMGPGYYDCPKRILDKLTACENDYAMEWREKCREKMKEKKDDQLKKIELGKAIRLTGSKYKGYVLIAHKHKKTKVFVDPFSRVYFTQKQVREIGYEVA